MIIAEPSGVALIEVTFFIRFKISLTEFANKIFG